MKCLLCGFQGDSALATATLPCCSWCVEEADALHPDEVSALHMLDTIQPAFQIWSRGRREDSETSPAGKRGKVVPATVPQPALIFPGMPLYVGDMDDAANLERLQALGIGCVINLCADRIGPKSCYGNVPGELASAGIHQHILVADDVPGFDIMAVAEHAMGAMKAALGSKKNPGVLVHCWGGVNRSAAVATAYLTTHCSVPLYAAVAQLMRQRGTVLTNMSFRKQLVRHCFKQGLSLEGEVPAALLVDSVVSPACSAAEATEALCPDASGRRHRGGGTKDTPICGLLNAARDGCLQCVTQYIEQDGVDPESESTASKYTARSWAEWQLQRARYAHERRRYEAILAYLSYETA